MSISLPYPHSFPRTRRGRSNDEQTLSGERWCHPSRGCHDLDGTSSVGAGNRRRRRNRRSSASNRSSLSPRRDGRSTWRRSPHTPPSLAPTNCGSARVSDSTRRCAGRRNSASSDAVRRVPRTRRRKDSTFAACLRAEPVARSSCSTACHTPMRSAAGCTGAARPRFSSSASRWCSAVLRDRSGNQALAGTLQIVSRPPQAGRGSVQVHGRAGNQTTFGGGFALTAGNARQSIILAADAFDTGGYIAVSDADAGRWTRRLRPAIRRRCCGPIWRRDFC